MRESERAAWSPADPADPVEVGLVEALRRAMLHASTPRDIDGAGCLLLDADCTLRYVSASGTPAEALEVAEELCVEGPCHEAFAGEDVQYADIQDESRWARLSMLLSASPIRTVIGVPIVLNGRSIGALNAYSALPRDWEGPDFEVLHQSAQTIADLVQRALDARLDDHGDQLTGQLRAALANRDRLGAAAELVMRSTGLPRASAMLRLRQVASASDQPTIDVADQVIEHGALPSLTDLATNAALIRHTREEMARMALTDPLTGLANRALFLDRLDQAIARAKRTGHHPAVVFIDLDRFKTVNDSLGHEAGDEVLRSVASRLEEVVRGQDTVARLGGDEFAVLCDAPREPETAERLAERIAGAVARPITVTAQVPGSPPGHEHQVTVHASVGVASVAGDHPTRATDLLRDADMAMYDAKDGGGGRVTVFTNAVRETGHRRMRLELALRALLEARGARRMDAGHATSATPARAGPSDESTGFRLVYQPIVELETGRIVSVEALVRGDHPDLGTVGASELIRTAENAGLISSLGIELLAQACEAAAAWQALPGAEELVVAVNVSPAQLSDPAFADTVAEVLERHDLEAKRLCFEITESRLLESAGASLDTLFGLRRLGLHLTLDDFGTGYSSLSYLAKLPVTRLKMDRAFVTGITNGASGSAIARAVVSLGRSLGLETVAEGIETPEQADHLRAIECELAQGFLYSHPVEGERIPDLLRMGVLSGRESIADA
jgi:diguanylate cyclase (GGDEF)-like protein